MAGVWLWTPEAPECYFVVDGPDGVQVVEIDDLDAMDRVVSGPYDRHDAIEACDLSKEEAL